MADPVRRRRFTIDEYHRMGEAGILGCDERLELITGHIVVRQVEHDLEPGQIITSNSRRVLHGSDGSKVTVESIFHLTLTPSGEVAVTFGEGGCSTT